MSKKAGSKGQSPSNRCSTREYEERITLVLELLGLKHPPCRIIAAITKRYGVVDRQAKRYIAEARLRLVQKIDPDDQEAFALLQHSADRLTTEAHESKDFDKKLRAHEAQVELYKLGNKNSSNRERNQANEKSLHVNAARPTAFLENLLSEAEEGGEA